MTKLSAHFLCMDENDPNVDYNAEDYTSKSVEYYLTEVDQFCDANIYLLTHLQPGMPETEIQTIVYDAARKYDEKNIRGYFKRLYQLLFSTSDGPRLPAFIAILGVEEFFDLMDRKQEEYL